MKISVTYSGRRYGNSRRSEASEVRISGSQNNATIEFDFKTPQPGRSWDWANASTVGGARIELRSEDAKALGEALLAFSRGAEAIGSGGTTDVKLLLRDGYQPEHTVRSETFEQRRERLEKQLNTLAKHLQKR